ncbi:MAG: SH3 domain-containing protein [Lachnospiraceae bacterium]|nr:SH3 domain-containing protein [Lachnospiraceae bacterium]
MNRKIMCLLALLIMTVSFKFTSTAAAGEQVLMETQKETNIYEKADRDSKAVVTLEKGTPVICCEAAGLDGWYEITYQGTKGYALCSDFDYYGDADGIDEGFRDVEEENLEQFERIQDEQLEKKNELLWGGIMAALIVLMFAVGIFTVLRNMKKGNHEEGR